MNIAIVRRQCGFEFGGAERYCANVSIGLSHSGHKVTVISDDSSLNELTFLRAKVYGRGSILKNLSFFYSVKKILKKHRFDLVYGLSRIENADFLRISDPLHLAWLKLGYKDRLLPFRIRLFMPRHLSILFQERKSIKSAKFIITNSKLVREQVKKIYGFPEKNIFTIYNGVDLKRFYPVTDTERKRIRKKLGIKDEEVAILFVGSDYKRKGLLILLDALAKLKDEFDFSLFVLGVFLKKGLAKRCNRLGLSDKVHFLGFRQDGETFYRASDLMCLPTFYDPFANVCLESIACGTPVITTDKNGAGEIIRELGEELLVTAGDSKVLKKAICRFLKKTKAEHKELREKCFFLSQRYGWEHHINKLLSLFPKLL